MMMPCRLPWNSWPLRDGKISKLRPLRGCALQKFTGTERWWRWAPRAWVHPQRRTRCKQQSDLQIFTPPALVASVPTVSRNRDEAWLRHMWRQVEHVCDVVSKASLWPRRGNLPKPRLFASPDRCRCRDGMDWWSRGLVFKWQTGASTVAWTGWVARDPRVSRLQAAASSLGDSRPSCDSLPEPIALRLSPLVQCEMLCWRRTCGKRSRIRCFGRLDLLLFVSEVWPPTGAGHP